MLEVPGQVCPEMISAAKGQRLLIPALAIVLDERGVTLGKPTYSKHWRVANGLPVPSKWLFDVYRRPLRWKALRVAYNRACIRITDILTYAPTRDTFTLRPQPNGSRPTFVRQIAQWIDPTTDDAMDEQERSQLRTAFTRELGPPPDVPFTAEELNRAYSQSHPSTQQEKWVAYTDGSVVQRGGQTMGAFAGTFTQGPHTPMDFAGRVTELPLSSTRMEAMAIAAVVAITPPTIHLEIHTDSQAAAYMMERVAAPMISRELTNSPDAFLWLHLRSWLQSRQAPVTVEWVRGHSGEPGNERADHLARDLGPRQPLGDPMDDPDAPTRQCACLDLARRPI